MSTVPPAAVSYAKRTPLGEVVTNDLKRSITRETTDTFFKTFSFGNEVTSLASLSNTAATINVAQDHGLGSLSSFSTLVGGSGHTDGTYYNVRLINNSSQPPANPETLYLVWDGATADVTVSGGSVTSATIKEGGSGYTNGEVLYFDVNQIGGTTGSGNITISTSDISDSLSDYVQVTGIGTATGGYYKINAVSNKREIGIAKTAGDPVVVAGEYVTVVGRVGTISSHAVSSGTHTFTVTAGTPSGLLAGNRVRLLDASNNNLGDYLVNSVEKGSTSPFTHTFDIVSSVDLSSAWCCYISWVRNILWSNLSLS